MCKGKEKIAVCIKEERIDFVSNDRLNAFYFVFFYPSSLSNSF